MENVTEGLTGRRGYVFLTIEEYNGRLSLVANQVVFFQPLESVMEDDLSRRTGYVFSTTE